MKVNIRKFLLEKYGSENADDVIDNFVTFMIDNDWFKAKPQIETSDGERTMLFDEDAAKHFINQFDFNFNNKDLEIEDKVVALYKRLTKKFPKTAEALNKYFTDEQNWNIRLYIYDFLLTYETKEIYEYENNEINALISLMCDEITLAAGSRFTDFLFQMRRDYKVAYTCDFAINSRITESRVKEAYNSDTFQRLSYYLFNPGYIRENQMFEAACDSMNTTNAWLYLALHMICALRDTDLTQLPHPRLVKQAEEIINLIRNGQFTDADATLTVLSVTRQMSFLSRQPNKTSRYSGICDIKLIIPESATALFGRLFALQEAHIIKSNKEDVSFVRPIRDYERISRYLGDEIGCLFLEDNFSVRSANKTYMQAVDLFADDILDARKEQLTHAKGYILAAIARSHKGSYNEFAHTTEIYLKDANFSGYNPEFIAFELFERGVCSFIPSMLLKMVTDGVYDKLAIHDQTKMVQELGLTPNNIEAMILFADQSIKSAVDVVNDIKASFADNADLKSNVLRILQNIACGNAASKQNECMCLMSAMNIECKNPNTRQCIGCKYEISTKATVYVLMGEFNRIYALREKTDTEPLRNKYTQILKDIVTPAIAEILICIRDTYGEEAIHELETIIREMQNGK